MNEWISTMGLALDIVGVVLLYFFGLPPKKVWRGGGISLAVGRNASVARKAKRYDCLSTLAMVLIVIGFILQIVAVWA